MPEITISNLFRHIPEISKKEIFDILAAGGFFRMERIVSFGQFSPEDEWFDQDEEEWVVLLRGEAEILFEGESSARLMKAGDYINIPAHKRHRLERTSSDPPAVWLAVHYVSSRGREEHASFIRKIEIKRTRKSRRNVSARINGDVMSVSAPLGLSEETVLKAVEELKERFKKRRLKAELNKDGDLLKAAEELNRRYFGGRLNISSVKYVTNQSSKFGSCSYHRGDIRIAHQVSSMPKWVRDYVLVHELAHLLEPNHGRDFWDLVLRYELSERARGYLMAKGL